MVKEKQSTQQKQKQQQYIVLCTERYVSGSGALVALDLTAVREAAVAGLSVGQRDARVAPPTAGAEVLTGVGSRGVRVALPTHRPQRAHRGVPDAVVGGIFQKQKLFLAGGRTARSPLSSAHCCLCGIAPDSVVGPVVSRGGPGATAVAPVDVQHLLGHGGEVGQLVAGAGEEGAGAGNPEALARRRVHGGFVSDHLYRGKQFGTQLTLWFLD